jgi:hypothetical protein
MLYRLSYAGYMNILGKFTIFISHKTRIKIVLASQEQNGKMKITLTWTNVEMKRNKSKATRKRDRKRHEQYIGVLGLTHSVCILSCTLNGCTTFFIVSLVITSLQTLVLTGTDIINGCKSNNHIDHTSPILEYSFVCSFIVCICIFLCRI